MTIGERIQKLEQKVDRLLFAIENNCRNNPVNWEDASLQLASDVSELRCLDG